MSVDEAEAFIERLLANWLEWKWNQRAQQQKST
jgi:hypothetical protein